jgi:hypothetical protein
MDLISGLCRQIITFPSNTVEEALFSPLYVFETIVKNKVSIAV